ncbi:hypothetical protein GCM10027093_69780 [Paraburkholderia jirisanensis]
MSVMNQAIHQAALSSKRAGGSLATQKNRRFDASGLLRFARQVGELHPSVQETPDWVVHLYAQYCVAQGKAPSTLANIFSSIRVLGTATGERITQTPGNAVLGITRRTRKGRKRAMTDTEIVALLKRAARSDEGLMHTISLALAFGLRRKEALMSAPDLQMWLEAIVRGDSHVRVMRGTKNGRPRTVRLLDARREQTRTVVHAALVYVTANGMRLISSQPATLEAAMNRFKSLLYRLGMSGEVSFHALRYTYALESANEMLAAGLSPYDTLVELSESLGHGPDRTRMILDHYCQPVRDRFAGKMSFPGQHPHSRRTSGGLPRAAARLEAKSLHAALSGYPLGDAMPAGKEHVHADGQTFPGHPKSGGVA